jgi:hypothetical protein
MGNDHDSPSTPQETNQVLVVEASGGILADFVEASGGVVMFLGDALEKLSLQVFELLPELLVLVSNQLVLLARQLLLLLSGRLKSSELSVDLLNRDKEFYDVAALSGNLLQERESSPCLILARRWEGSSSLVFSFMFMIGTLRSMISSIRSGHQRPARVAPLRRAVPTFGGIERRLLMCRGDVWFIAVEMWCEILRFRW